MRAIVLCAALLSHWITVSTSQSNDRILARIGQKEISVRELLERSELTFRPNNFKDKKTTLNNLISEKILALEAARRDSALLSPVLEATLKGIKEQAMRMELYRTVAYENVELDTSEVKNAYRMSMREYDLEFYTIREKGLARKIEALLDSVPSISDEMFKDLRDHLGEKPVHRVKYKDQDDDAIHESLFTKPLQVGTIVGPLKLGNGDYIIMRVLNWVDYPLLSGEDQQVRWKEVKERLRQVKANKQWGSYQANVMRGKKLEFNEHSFKVLSNLALEYYLRNQDSLKSQLSEVPFLKPEIDFNAPFFTISAEGGSTSGGDGKTWTVGDFRRELLSHPLVFRTRSIDQSNFSEQFKLAIVDMMRDYYLTQEAHKRSLDRSESTKKTVEMWRDAFLAVRQQKSIMNSALEKGIIDGKDNPGMLNYWISYLRSLQEMYGSSIQISYEEFNKVSLTKVDMFAWQPKVPYPVAVPQFPIFISSDNLDYVRQEE